MTLERWRWIIEDRLRELEAKRNKELDANQYDNARKIDEIIKINKYWLGDDPCSEKTKKEK